MSRILARFRRHQLEAEHATILHTALLHNTAEQADPKHERTMIADGAQLRGIPAIGKFSNPGAVRGTNPEAETLRRDGLRRRRA